MKALIIAAGDGTRMRPFTKRLPKPLLPLLGLTLVERVILGAREAGVREFVIVLGYKGRKIQKFLGDGQKYGVKISYLKNKEWRKENGVSVFCAKNLLRENFLLLMADHVFDPAVLKRFLKLKVRSSEGVLCVDKNFKDIFNLEDATKVRLEKEKIVAIGKDLKKFDGVDTGIFLLSPAIFKVLEKNIAQKKYSLTAAIEVLAKKGKMRAWLPRKILWVDVDDFSDFSFAQKRLLASLVKKEDGVISRNLNRKISGEVSKVLVNTSLTPAQISLANFLIGLLAAFFFAQGRYPEVAIGGILTQVNSILDGCDGEVARLKFLASNYGAFWDACLDKLTDTFGILGMSLGIWKKTHNFLIFLVSFWALAGIMLISYVPTKYENLFKRKIKFLSGGVNKRDVRLFLIMLGGIFNQVFLALLLLAIVSNLISLGRILLAPRD